MTWTTALCNSMKLGHAVRGYPRWPGHDGEGWQNVVHWRREWQTTSVYLPWEPHEQHEKAKWEDTERGTARSVSAQYATGDQWRNTSRKTEGVEPKQTQYPAVVVTGVISKVKCCNEQYCIGTWNARFRNQGKVEVVKQGIARVNIDILGIRELKWTGMDEFNSDDHDISYCGQESLRRNGVAITVNKRIWNEVLRCPLKNDRMISVRLQGKPFNISYPSLCPNQ